MLNVGDPVGQERVLVLKANRELNYLDPCDKTVFAKATQMKANDGIHIAWKLFDSFTAMECFIKARRAQYVNVEESSTSENHKELFSENRYVFLL